MKNAWFLLSLMAVSCAYAKVPAANPATLPRTKAPAGVELYFITPKDGETVGQDVIVRFGLKGMGVAPAGVQSSKAGHHHLLVDAKEMPSMDQPIAKDETHLHFGAGQTETILHFAPGDHTLQLLLGDAMHMPFDPPIASKRITVHVK